MPAPAGAQAFWCGSGRYSGYSGSRQPPWGSGYSRPPVAGKAPSLCASALKYLIHGHALQSFLQFFPENPVEARWISAFWVISVRRIAFWPRCPVHSRPRDRRACPPLRVVSLIDKGICLPCPGDEVNWEPHLQKARHSRGYCNINNPGLPCLRGLLPSCIPGGEYGLAVPWYRVEVVPVCAGVTTPGICDYTRACPTAVDTLADQDLLHDLRGPALSRSRLSRNCRRPLDAHAQARLTALRSTSRWVR